MFLWNVYGDRCDNQSVLKFHTNAILDLKWSVDGTKIITCSADKTIVVMDSHTLKSIKKLKGHDSIVNSISITRKGEDTLVSGSDDGKIKIWDIRTRKFAMEFDNSFPVTAVEFSENGDKIFSGGLDNQVKAWNMRKNQMEYIVGGNRDTVTGLCLSPDGSYLLCNSMD